MPCRRGVVALNPFLGCGHGCLYCYAQGYRGSPPPGTVQPVSDLLPRLCQELGRGRLPPMVSLSTTTDPFPPHPTLLELSYRAMELLLERGIRLSLLTKGFILPAFCSLFRRFPGRVYVTIGLVSLDPFYHRIWEPGTVPAQARLENLERLGEAGVPVVVRIDPVIPGVSDDEEGLGELFRALARRRVERVAVGFLFLRPSLLPRLRQGLLPSLLARLLPHYAGSPFQRVGGSATTQLLHPGYRRQAYQKLKAVAASFGVSAALCACKNPDLGGDPCHREADAYLLGGGSPLLL